MIDIYALRLEKLRKNMDEKELEGIILCPGPNLKYYTDCDALLEERVLLFFIASRGENHLLASKFDLGPFRNSTSEMVIHEWDESEGPSRAFKELTRTLPFGDSWGHETRVPFQFLNEMMMKHSKAVWMEAEPILQNMREVKEEGEIRVLKKAASILSESSLQITEMLEPGMTEAELSRRLNAEIFSRGADSVYGVNVQAGGRGGDPELLTSSRKIRRMEPATIDISCTYSGYFADMTRTVSVGRSDGRFEELYGKVLEAQERAIKASEVGVSAGEIDLAARGYLKSENLARYFNTRIGHGLGIEVHESPYLQPNERRRASTLDRMHH